VRRAAPLLIAFVAIVLAWLGLQRSFEARRVDRASRPRTEGRIEVRGPQAPLRILRDARGVPHVEAASEADAYFGLGFAHAQDRLGQMVSLRLAARGRTAEVIGEAGLAADRRARVIGIARLAERETPRLPAATHRLLRAYAAGVNARLERLRAGLGAPPAQFTLETLPLEAWEPADSVAVLKAWAWGLGGSLDASLVLDDLLRTLGPELARPFFPVGAGIAPVPGERPSMARHGPRGPGAPPGDPLRRALGLDAHGVGSSAWVIAGSASASGRPLLAGDAHLEATVPALLHHAHLRGGALDVAGAALPGVPVFWSGASRDVAWAATAARASVIDLFVESLEPALETLGPDEPGRYHDGRRWRKLAVREERIAVAGGDEQTLLVRETERGPLVNAILDEEREPLALAWTGARSGDGIGPMMAAARAADGDAFVAALADHHEPVLAFVWADARGAAGLQVAGWVPLRALPSGLVPVSARSTWARWQDPVPAGRLPAARVSRERPFLVAADAPLETGPGRRVEWLWRTGERARWLEARLAEAVAAGGVSLRRMTRLQADTVSAGAEALLAPVFDLAGSPEQLAAEEREVLELLRGWDRRAAADSVGAAVYHVFQVELARELFAPVLGEALYARWSALRETTPLPMTARVLAAGAAGGGGLPEWTRGRLIDAVRRSLRSTWLRFGVEVGPNREKWTWGRLHALRFAPFGVLRWPDAGEDPALGPHPFPGDLWSAALGGYDWAEPFAVRAASIHRMAVDAAELDKLLVALAPGQAEQPGHPHRADGVAPWLAGEPQLLLTSPVLLEEQAAARLEIVPAEAP
jgi:penicillin amidase